MAFVKFDCGMLDSSLWVDKDSRDLFITALLMAVPHVAEDAQAQLSVHELEPTGWVVPPGLYGQVKAAGVGIINRCGGIEKAPGLAALERLGSPDPESRSEEFEGRRLVRVNGGYLVLNYEKYRERDITAADRAKRYREKQAELKAAKASHRDGVTVTRDVTQGEGEGEGEAEEEKQRQLLGDERQADPVLEPVEMWIPCVGAAGASKPKKLDRLKAPWRVIIPDQLPEGERWGNPAPVLEYGITVSLVAELMALYPGVDVRAELRGLIGWSRGEAKRRRTYARMAAWLSERVGSRQGRQAAGTQAGSRTGRTGGVCDRCKGERTVYPNGRYGGGEPCKKCQGTGVF